MCGRISQTFSFEDLFEYFQVTNGITLEPRYNLAPSQEVFAIREKEGERFLSMLHWGLIPFWSKDRKVGYRTLNARSETAHKSPAFRAAFRGRRCLIPASGYYEWDKRGGTKQPYYIHRSDGEPIALAGLWEHWEDKERGEVIESCTILTTEATESVAQLHDRMPVILSPEKFDLWLSSEEQNVDRLRDLLDSTDVGILSMYPVSKYVNKAGNEGAKCIEPLKSV